jgi:hypothetical protein
VFDRVCPAVLLSFSVVPRAQGQYELQSNALLYLILDIQQREVSRLPGVVLAKPGALRWDVANTLGNFRVLQSCASINYVLSPTLSNSIQSIRSFIAQA